MSRAHDRDLFDGVRDALSDLHRGPGTANGEALDGCPGCDAQAMLDEIAARTDAYRDALERIAAHPHGGLLVNVARRALGEQR